MNLKTLALTIAVLAALSAAVYFAQRSPIATVTDRRVGQTLVDRPLIEQAAELRLSDQGKLVDLVRQPDRTWRVASYYDLPADFTKLAGFIANLTEAKLQRLVTSNPERVARLEFKETKIELLDSTAKPLWSVTLGKNADTGGGRYVRFGHEEKAYLANLNAWLDPEAKNWADSQILNVKPEEIARVEIPFAEGGPVTVSRGKKDEAWTADKTPTGQRVKADKISSVFGSIGSVRFSNTVEPSDANVAAAKAHERTFKFVTFGGQTYTVAMGRKPEEKRPKPPATLTAPAAEPEKKAEMPKENETKIAEGKPTDTKPLAPLPGDQLRPATAGANPGPAATGNATAGTVQSAPEFETITAGPVFVFVSSSDSKAPVNGLMQKRAFEISDYTFTGLPQKADELFETVPPPPAPAVPAKPVDRKGDEPSKH